MWGLSPKTCKWIYRTVVRPIMSYSATVWVRALDNEHNLKKLERVQALALRIITGGISKHSTHDWTVETAPSVKGTIKSHSYINNNFLNELNISKKEIKDLTKPILILDRNYHITTPNDDDTTYYRENLDKLIKESFDCTITCYSNRELGWLPNRNSLLTTPHNK